MSNINVAVIGLGFGGEFVPIYKKHNGAECVAVCRRNKEELDKFADQFEIQKRYTSFTELLKDDEIDAVHINTAIADHGPMAIEALNAGKHVACTVPMSCSVDECLEIARLEKETGKVYMMMETAVYTREFLYVLNLYKTGQLGEIQFLRGSHQQNMSLPGWPAYWYGFPPMWYATHAVSPLAALIDKKFKTVRCLGSGRIEQEYIQQYNSPFAVESAQFTFAESEVCCEVTRSLFKTIRQYRESFDVYGTVRSFEWEQVIGGHPVLYSGYEDVEQVVIPDTDSVLPPEIAPFTLKNKIVDDQHVSFIQGDGHGGSHPHLVWEFLSAIKEKRPARVNGSVAANWTMAGILAHESAMKNGAILEIPE